MKKFAIVCLAICCVAALALAVVYNESNFNALGRMYQPAPEGHTPGKDNAPGLGMHHPGESCSLCHRPEGRAASHVFTMSGTLYKDRSGRSTLKGGEIVMQDRAGNVISMTSNVTGNFWTTAPIASDPYTVSSYHGGPPFTPMYVLDDQGNLVQPADPTDSRTWKYKTWVRKGYAVRPMVMVPAAGGGMAAPRMSCNMHHGGVAHRSGALWVGKESTLPFYPATGLSYRKHIYPILRSQCSPCHVPGKTTTPVNTKTDLDTPSTVVDYSGGLDLMTYEGSTVDTIVKRGVGSVVDTANPKQSLLLHKTVLGELHAGGAFWNERSRDYTAIRQWITEGAQKN